MTKNGKLPSATSSRDLRIDAGRLWDSLMEMATIGPGVSGGNNRQALTDEDSAGRHLFQSWCNEAGLSIAVDDMGNMFAQRPGEDPDALPVYVGSHLDTQPTGGKYDGVLGVLAGLEVVRALNDRQIKTRRPIVVVNWTNEEGSRFSPPILSSGVFAGVYRRDWAHERTDAEGRTLGDELVRTGWRGDEITGNRKIHAFFELHIEQGPVLEAEARDVGIVTHAQGLSCFKVTIRGEDSHTGATPMPMRRNAGLGMAEVLRLIEDVALSFGPDAVGGVGHFEIYPNSPNVIPGKVVFTVDLRSPSLDTIETMEARVKDGAKSICEKMNLAVSFERIRDLPPVAFDEGCIAALRNGAERFAYSHRDLISGAGHDACWINRVAPTAMVMCPCVGGISHNEAEEITREWAEAGANVLLHAVSETATIIE